MGAGMVISVQPPSDPITGMQWLDSSTAEVWIWDEDKWLQFPVGGSGGGVGANVEIEEFPPEYPTWATCGPRHHGRAISGMDATGSA